MPEISKNKRTLDGTPPDYEVQHVKILHMRSVLHVDTEATPR